MKKEFKRILVITDNLFIYKKFRQIIQQAGLNKKAFVYRFSVGNQDFLQKFSHSNEIAPIDVQNDVNKIIMSFDLVISAHSKQIFPAKIVNKIKCINIHPGYNPYNRGWFPQVFSILNGMPFGATIHEIDEKIDHGKIIDQVTVPLYQWDTSLSAYKRVLNAEMKLVKKNIVNITKNNYESKISGKEGNINLKKDFNALCEINLDKRGRFEEFINYLRAMSHGHYKNAYFVDKESGKKIFVSIVLRPDK